MQASPLISCLCISHDRVPLLRNAVENFFQQTWPRRELIVLHEDRDVSTAAWLAALAHPAVRSLVVPALPHLSLGAKRNMAVAAAQGSHVATWDDDDWHAPRRLERQMETLAASGAPACTLRRETVYDAATHSAWLTQPRIWENTLVAEKAAMPPYPPLERGSDTVCVQALTARGAVAWLDAPELYIYHVHGRNVNSRGHFRRKIFNRAQALNGDCADRLQQLLSDPTRPALTAEDLLLAPG